MVEPHHPLQVLKVSRRLPKTTILGRRIRFHKWDVAEQVLKNFEQIYHGRAGYLRKVQSRDGQIS